MLLLGAVSFAAAARTGHLGSEIRHSEIRSGGDTAVQEDESREDRDD